VFLEDGGDLLAQGIAKILDGGEIEHFRETSPACQSGCDGD
jgi:hypothetical protein